MYVPQKNCHATSAADRQAQMDTTDEMIESTLKIPDRKNLKQF